MLPCSVCFYALACAAAAESDDSGAKKSVSYFAREGMLGVSEVSRLWGVLRMRAWCVGHVRRRGTRLLTRQALRGRGAEPR